MQLLSYTMGDTSLQEDINMENIIILNDYVQCVIALSKNAKKEEKEKEHSVGSLSDISFIVEVSFSLSLFLLFLILFIFYFYRTFK